ncbi:uncharacterized protein PFL1_06012 [Pseudozyma flocculosa PF-1]|uniref:Velvet domain-containing protein n=2 Tax=Pseudozyma flocculosa TaxID=84751 RepID=A0A5C3F537_9BASI|nr:uncharacterized protein PFL1_06012 [Pseudozyma flocculosa PF-1]EPQ26364.1 hypothetical protein PFL1_06012 [Pseudozyma flocculosa PF-1]SPO39045.1 uncharacterized protein PSFLO_04524 [Pseudozyma flocculosa]
MRSSPSRSSKTPAKRAQADRATAAEAGKQEARPDDTASPTVATTSERSSPTSAPKRRKSVGVAITTPSSSAASSQRPSGQLQPSAAPADSTQPSAAAPLGPGQTSGDADSDNKVDEGATAEAPAGSGLDEKTSAIRYRLRIAQQPTAASAFGDELLSRLAAAPPLILELDAVDEVGDPVDISSEVPFLICQVAITLENGNSADIYSPSPVRSTPSSSVQASPTPSSSRGRAAAQASPAESPAASGSRDASAARPSPTSTGRGGAAKRRGRRRSGLNPSPARGGATTPPSASPLQEVSPPARMLYGTLAANPIPYDSPEGAERLYLLFPEISIRAAGRFRLRCFLIRLPIPGSSPAPMGALAEVLTEPFDVVPSSDYVAPHLTDLTRHLARQGAGLLLPPGQAAD